MSTTDQQQHRLRGTALIAGLVTACRLSPLAAFGQVEGQPGEAKVPGIEVTLPKLLRDVHGHVLQARHEPGEETILPEAFTQEAAEAKERAERGEAFPTTKTVVKPRSQTRRSLERSQTGSGLWQRASETGPQPEAPVLGNSFPGVTFNGFIPPDPSLAAGPSHVVASTNGTINVFTKTGALAASQSPTGLFSALGPPATDGPFDPHLVFDPYISRFWFVATSSNDSAMRSTLLVALSRSSDASAGWTVFGIEIAMTGNSTLWCDFPRVGIDAQAVYFTCNMFTFPRTRAAFQTAKLRVMTKDQFLNGTCCHWWDFFNLRDGGPLASSLAPARMEGAAAADGEFLLDAHGGGGTSNALEVWRVTNPQTCCTPGSQSAPNLTQIARSVGRFDAPPDAKQPGSTTNIDTGDSHLLYAFWQSGLLSTGHTVAGPTGTAAAAAFTELDVSGFPTVGVVNDWVLAAPGVDYYYPAADTTSIGNKIMVYGRSSLSQFASTDMIGIPSSSVCQNCFDSSETTLQNGQGTYVRLDTRQANRWGDFFGASADPNGTDVWVHGEFATAANTWATEVGVAAPGAPIVQLSPTSLTFAEQAFGTTSPAQPVTLSNAGLTPLTITSIAANNDFSQTNNCPSPPATVAPNANCTIQVTFSPADGGSRIGAITISDNAAGNPHTAALSGTGPDFSLSTASGSSPNATVTAGQAATYNLTLTGSQTFSGLVALTCAGAPTSSTCSAAPGSVMVNGPNPVNAMVTVTTTARSTAAPRQPFGPWTLGKLETLAGPAGLLFLLPGLLALAIWSRFGAPRRRKAWRAVMAIICAALFSTTCGGGGSKPPSNPVQTGTSAGTFTLLVSGTFTSSSATIRRDLLLMLTVQ